MDDLRAVTAELPYSFHSIRTAQYEKVVKNSYPHLNSTEANTLIIWVLLQIICMTEGS